MNNFPFINHLAIELLMRNEILVNDQLIEQMSSYFISMAGLKVVNEVEHNFPEKGLTKIFVLSQSHMIVHTWPEKSAIHFDIMTCSQSDIEAVAKKIIEKYRPINFQIKKLEY